MAEGIAKLHPIPRLGEAADAANLAAFLLSPDSPWITGQVMRVDGGRSHLRTRG
jgi:NAD(P)-dependent dehydrogenase (short-subunit alcohol dehydrogenase family)